MSLFEALEARGPRRARVVLARPETEEAFRGLVDASSQVQGAERAGAPPQQLAALRQALAAARKAAEAAPDPDVVELVALEPDEFEDLRALHTDPKTGDLDHRGMRAPLIAACAVQAEYRDAERWARLFKSKSLHQGAIESLWSTAYNLNAAMVPVEYISAPKG